MEGKIGVEPTFEGFADRAVTIPAHFPIKTGAENGIRTHDIHVGNVTLYP